jgi:hypothetical protein
MHHTLTALAVALAVATSAHAQTTAQTTAQATDLPAAVKAPEGHMAAMTWTGTGQLTYECRAKADDAAMFEWAFVGPDATLTDARSKVAMGKYSAGPTWETPDGATVTGKQVAVAPAGAGNIPLQLVKAERGTGALEGVTYVQRVNTNGGVAPAARCDASAKGAKQAIPYSADYVFYKAG